MHETMKYFYITYSSLTFHLFLYIFVQFLFFCFERNILGKSDMDMCVFMDKIMYRNIEYMHLSNWYIVDIRHPRLLLPLDVLENSLRCRLYVIAFQIVVLFCQSVARRTWKIICRLLYCVLCRISACNSCAREFYRECTKLSRR